VGFDIDDTVLNSEQSFIISQKMGNGAIDYAWINTHDRQNSVPIPPTVKLIKYFIAHGHAVFFITARPGDNGQYVGDYLSEIAGFSVNVDETLFFSPKETVNGFDYTTKHIIMEKLDLDLFYGDSDRDIMAAIKARVFPVRIVRSQESIKSYSRNYFGDTKIGDSAAAPFNADDLKIFYNSGTGPFGESIYPITWELDH